MRSRPLKLFSLNQCRMLPGAVRFLKTRSIDSQVLEISQTDLPGTNYYWALARMA